MWSYLRSTVARTIPLHPTVPKETLVIDLLGGCRRYFDPHYLWDFTTMRQRVRRDVEVLRKAGFEILVFSDAGERPEPTNTWIRRRRRDLQVTQSPHWTRCTECCRI